MKGQVIYIENIPFENFTKIKVFSPQISIWRQNFLE